MRIRDHRLKTESLRLIEREHPSTDFWLLLESSIDGTNTVQKYNRAYTPALRLANRGLYHK